jgi:hypothetical protein
MNSRPKPMGGTKKVPSLSVRQLIDERIEKLEAEERKTIDLEFESKLVSLRNSLRVKTMKLENMLGITLSDTNLVEHFEDRLSSKLAEVESTLGKRVDKMCRSSYRHGRPFKLSTEPLMKAMDIDSCIKRIREFDNLVSERFDDELEHKDDLIFDEQQEDLEHLLTISLRDAFNSILTSRREKAPKPRTAEAPTVDLVLPDIVSLLSKHDQTDDTFGLDDVHLRDLLNKLMRTDIVEHHLHKSIDNEMMEIDSKYLKLIAEASSIIHTVAQGTTSTSEPDPIFVRKVLPAVLKDNEQLLQDMMIVIGEYCNNFVASNPRLERLLNLEKSRIIR